MLPNEGFGVSPPLCQVLVSFHQISATWKNMFSIPLATDQTPPHFLQGLGFAGAPGRGSSSSTGCSGTAVSPAFKGYFVDTSGNDALLHTGASVAAFSSLTQ